MKAMKRIRLSGAKRRAAARSPLLTTPKRLSGRGGQPAGGTFAAAGRDALRLKPRPGVGRRLRMREKTAMALQ